MNNVLYIFPGLDVCVQTPHDMQVCGRLQVRRPVGAIGGHGAPALRVPAVVAAARGRLGAGGRRGREERSPPGPCPAPGAPNSADTWAQSA